jgi:hypothetical protein
VLASEMASGAPRPKQGWKLEDGSPKGPSPATAGLVNDSHPRGGASPKQRPQSYWRRSGVGRYLSPAMRMNSRKLRRPTSRLNVAMTYFELTVLITQKLPSFVTD